MPHLLNADVAGLDANNRLVARLDHEPTFSIPTVQSGYITEGVSIPAAAPLKMDYLVDPSPPGDCTISHPSGKVAIAAGASAVVITNTLVTTATMCFVSKLSLDSVLVDFKAVCTSNTITITGNGNANADCYFYFFIVQQTP